MNDWEDMRKRVIAFRSVGLGTPTYPLPRGWRLANATAIPYTGKRGHGSYFRSPSGKRRALIEGARAVPPDAYDDIHFAHKFSRNWKRHRKVQWRDNPKPPQYWAMVNSRRKARRPEYVT